MDVLPKTCPGCKSPYWNAPRRDDILPEHVVTCRWKAHELENKTVRFELRRHGKTVTGLGWFSTTDLSEGRMHIAIKRAQLPGEPEVDPIPLVQAEADCITTYFGRGWRFTCCPPM